jgi:hypothetical protein
MNTRTTKSWSDLTFDLEDGQRAEFSRVTGAVITRKVIGVDGTGEPFAEFTFDDGSTMLVTPEGFTFEAPSPRSPKVPEDDTAYMLTTTERSWLEWTSNESVEI